MYLTHIVGSRCRIPSGNEEIGSYRTRRIACRSRRVSRYRTYIHGDDGVGLGKSDAGTASVDPAHYVVPYPDGIISVT